MEEFVFWHFSRFESYLWLMLIVLKPVLLFLAPQLCGEHEGIYGQNPSASRVLLAVTEADFEGGVLEKLPIEFSRFEISRFLIVFQVLVQGTLAELGVGAGEAELFESGCYFALDLRKFASMLEQVGVDGASLEIARAVFNGAVFAKVVEAFSQKHALFNLEIR